MDPTWPNMLWKYLNSCGHQANGIGLTNILAIRIFSVGIRDFASLHLKLSTLPFLYASNDGYNHLILTGNGSIDVGTTPCTLCSIMRVMSFDFFHCNPWWYTNVWKYCLLCQCQYMNWKGLQYDTIRVVSYLKGWWLMLILQNQHMTLYMISSPNGKRAGHWQTVSFPQTLLWLYRQLLMEWLSWWVMILANPFSLPK